MPNSFVLTPKLPLQLIKGQKEKRRKKESNTGIGGNQGKGKLGRFHKKYNN